MSCSSGAGDAQCSSSFRHRGCLFVMLYGLGADVCHCVYTQRGKGRGEETRERGVKEGEGEEVRERHTGMLLMRCAL